LSIKKKLIFKSNILGKVFTMRFWLLLLAMLALSADATNDDINMQVMDHGDGHEDHHNDSHEDDNGSHEDDHDDSHEDNNDHSMDKTPKVVDRERGNKPYLLGRFWLCHFLCSQCV
jgi:hypothetical protein